MSTNRKFPLDSRTLDEGIVLAINKPLHWTSFDVVKKLKTIFSIKKVGHAGTLDPLATGLLLVCTGKKTKAISYYQSLTKTYTGEMVLGKTTPSIDLETVFDSETPCEHVTETAVRKLASTFLGYISQIPPAYSAVRIQGRRAYQLARQNQAIVLPSRQVFVQSFCITAIDVPNVQFEIVCSKGTYIRSIVRDFGKRLGVGAYLSRLCRTHIGKYGLEDASNVDDLSQGKSLHKLSLQK